MTYCLSERWGKEPLYFSRSDASNSRLLNQRTPLEQQKIPEPQHVLRGNVIHLPVARSKEGIHFFFVMRQVSVPCYGYTKLPPSSLSPAFTHVPPPLPSFLPASPSPHPAPLCTTYIHTSMDFVFDKTCMLARARLHR